MTQEPPREPSGLSRFVAELRRRHVFRGTVAYAAVAFVVLQAAEIVVPAFDLPSLVLQLVVVAAVLGLPVAAALAWVYEITPRGIRTMRELDAEAGLGDRHGGELAPRLALLVVTLTAARWRGDPKLATLRADPVWDPVRDDPRFRGIFRQVMEFRGPGDRGG